MGRMKVFYVYHLSQPEKAFLACDMDNSDEFVDPLILFKHPSYDVYNINSQGLYAIGGELDTDILLKSYKWGIFPWFPYKDSESPHWYCPRERFVIFPDKIHVGHSLRNLLNKNKYHITINRKFPEVIHYCREVNGRANCEGAWLGDTIENLFIKLY